MSAQDGAVARIVNVQFGRVDGVFGLHLRLSFGNAQMSDYTLTDFAEMEHVMNSFGASTLEEMLNRKMRIRRYPLPLGSYSVLG